MYNGSSGAWVHASCLDEPARLEAVAEGKCFFCLDGSHLPDMTPFAPVSPTDTSWDDPDELAWAHRSCVDWFEAVLDEATDPEAAILLLRRHGGAVIHNFGRRCMYMSVGQWTCRHR
jgi:hypothetical protein